MKDFEIRKAKAALLDKSILGYRKPAEGSRRSERVGGAKVGAIKTKPDSHLVRVTDAKVGTVKSKSRSLLVRVTDAKVGLDKIRI